MTSLVDTKRENSCVFKHLFSWGSTASKIYRKDPEILSPTRCLCHVFQISRLVPQIKENLRFTTAFGTVLINNELIILFRRFWEVVCSTGYDSQLSKRTFLFSQAGGADKEKTEDSDCGQGARSHTVARHLPPTTIKDFMFDADHACCDMHAVTMNLNRHCCRLNSAKRLNPKGKAQIIMVRIIYIQKCVGECPDCQRLMIILTSCLCTKEPQWQTRLGSLTEWWSGIIPKGGFVWIQDLPPLGRTTGRRMKHCEKGRAMGRPWVGTDH